MAISYLKSIEKVCVTIKCFPSPWFQIKTKDKIIYIDPAYLRSHLGNYPKKIEFTAWSDPIDGLPEEFRES